MGSFEDAETQRLATMAAEFSAGIDQAERERDIATLRAIVRKYGGRFVDYATTAIDSEPAREQTKQRIADEQAEIARRIANDEPLTAGQVCMHVYDSQSEQSPDRVRAWIDYLLDSAANSEPNRRGEWLRSAVLLLSRHVDGKLTRDPRWRRVAELNDPPRDSSVSRELRRRGVITG